MARARLQDSQILLDRGRFDGAVYLCGYAIELALKARICTTLGWREFQTGKNFQSFKTHDLDTLLTLSGREEKIKTSNMADWSYVLTWSPEARYNPIGTATRQAALDLIRSAQVLLKVL